VSKSSINEQIEAIQQRLDSTKRLPVPTLEVIGEEQVEAHWQSLLVYFIRPNNPHGFGSDVLSAFLEAIKSHSKTELTPESYDADEIKIQSEVPTGNGVVDLLITHKDDWFMCIELKVRSSETGNQTVRYANASHLGNLAVSEYESKREYLYLAPDSSSEPISDLFVSISWRQIISELENIQREGQGQYPAKSTAQLADYIDTIKRELNMTDTNEISEETRLYIEHHDLVDRLRDSFKDERKSLYRQLKRAFFDESDIDPDHWQVNNSPKRYINFYKESWRSLDTGTSFEYEPHIRLKRENPHIRLRLDIEQGDKEVIRNEFKKQLGEDELEKLETNGWEITEDTYGYLGKSIPIDLESPEESIRDAVRDLHQLRDIIEPYIETVSEKHQTE
jgi:regulator of replication initiation timing